jgi:hypothetical protein
MKRRFRPQWGQILPWLSVVPLLIAFWGYWLGYAGESGAPAGPGQHAALFFKALYSSVQIYGLSVNNELLALDKPGYVQLEVARWLALLVTTSVFATLVRSAARRMGAFFRALRPDAVPYTATRAARRCSGGGWARAWFRGIRRSAFARGPIFWPLNPPGRCTSTSTGTTRPSSGAGTGASIFARWSRCAPCGRMTGSASATRRRTVRAATGRMSFCAEAKRGWRSSALASTAARC